MAKIIPGNPEQDTNIGGVLQEQKQDVEKATASAAENLVFLMQMLQDFSRTIKTVTTAPGFTAEAYRRIVVAYQHHLNPQVERYLSNLEKSNKMTKEQIQQERLLNQEFSTKIQRYVLLGGAISGLAFKLANLQERMEEAAFRDTLGSFKFPGQSGVRSGPAGVDVRDPNAVEALRGMTATQMRFELEKFRYDLLGDAGEVVAQKGPNMLVDLQPLFRSAKIADFSKDSYDLEIQKGIVKALATFETAMGVNTQRVADVFISRYGGKGGDIPIDVNMLGKFLNRMYEFFQTSDIGTLSGTDFPTALNKILTYAQTLEEGSGGAVRFGGESLQMATQLFDTFTATAAEGGLQQDTFDRMFKVLAASLDPDSMLNKLLARTGRGGILSNQDEFIKLAKEDAPAAILKVVDYFKTLDESVPKGELNTAIKKQIEALADTKYLDFKVLIEALGKVARKTSDVKLTFDELNKSMGLWEYDRATKTFKETLPRPIEDLREAAPTLENFFSKMFGKAQTWAAENIPKNATYIAGAVGTVVSLALPLLALRGMTRGGGGAGDVFKGLVALNVLEQAEKKKQAMFTEEQGVLPSPIDSFIDTGSNLGMFYLLNKYLKIKKDVPGAKELGKTTGLGVGSNLGKSAAIGGRIGSKLKGMRVFNKIGMGIGAIFTLYDSIDLVFKAFDDTVTKGEIAGDLIDIASSAAMTFGGPVGFIAGGAVKVTKAMTSDYFKPILPQIEKKPIEYRKYLDVVSPRHVEDVGLLNLPRPERSEQQKFDEFMEVQRSTEQERINNIDLTPLTLPENAHLMKGEASGVGIEDLASFLEALKDSGPGHVIVTFTDVQGNIVGQTENAVGSGDREIVRLAAADIRVVG